jgi:hypothetical protein
MSAEGIWAWKPEFNQYPLCPKYLANLKKQVKVRCFVQRIFVLFNLLTFVLLPMLLRLKRNV